MTKQEFLAFSLPYGLHGKIKNTICELTRMGAYTINTKPSVHSHTYCLIEDFIPILRPLSDLTKEIEHKGENFVPIVEINKRNEYIHAVNGRIGIGLPIIGYRDVDDMDELPTWLTQFLVELHFDIADLISKGEAIDVNTLDINPYK